ncbi:TonB-dependent receptor domain-containing protein [Sphingomonas quercus]|uniref:TonB-dependent receptor n=1 Tax=Sphingomonas quercus TaxID=2842451 RepID=A0ABS6BK58_9SPHN|nr:TonB-dependent receptor [Sphingomonas quercus]MBU3077605.1 TonB-dependent receptor [Sphingomonas quercus]
MRAYGLLLLGQVSVLSIAAVHAAPAAAADVAMRNFNVPAQPARAAVLQFARQAGIQVLVSSADAEGVTSGSVTGGHSVEEGLHQLIAPGSLRLVSFDGRTAVLARRSIVQNEAPSGPARPAAAARVQAPNSPATAAPPADAPDAGAVSGDAGGEIVVTGSRIQNGNNLPTPVTVVSTQQLQATTPTSIPDGLNRLPQFNAGQQTPNNSVNANGRGFGAPGNFLNLRSLGAIRTLILQDGNRVPGTFYDTTVDTNMLPQLLIQRVEVVTGGASAVYGSDAVTGVVNFITDNKFTGIKGLAQGGISKYGDAKSVRVGVAYGVNVGDRGHFEASAEFYKRNGVDDTASRPYGRLYPAVVGAGTSANPYRLVYGARQSNAAPGGLVMTGPFAGMQFLSDGSLAPFNPGTPTVTANAAIGGDGGYVHNEYLLSDLRTAQGFARFDYDLTDDVHFYVQGRYASNRTYAASQIYTNISNANAANPTSSAGSYPLWIYSDNAFLSAAQQATLATSGTSSFAVNRFDNDLMRQLALELKTRAGAATVGLNGTLLGDYAWDFHYTHGENRSRYTSLNNVNSANFFAAADAVRDPATGNIVCRVTLSAPGAFPGCAPINLFGQDRASAAAQDFIFDDTWWVARNSMDDFGANLTGTVFEGWAGPIKAAIGGQYRHQSLKVTTSTPDPTFNPQYLRLGAAGNSLPGSYPASNLRYFKEVQSGATGGENIYEANIEADVPLLRDLPFVQLLTFNGAYRYARYEASGNGGVDTSFSASTWKLGLEWTVIDGVRVRATRSREFRAPTLWDLYQAQIISASGVTDPLTNVAAQLNTVTGGNPELRPEIAKNITAGVVVTPRFFPGFSLSVDYYNVKIDNAIGSVSGLNPIVQNLCLASDGSSPYCQLVVRPISYNDKSAANFPTLNYSLNQNIARVQAKGIDVEANYRLNLESAGALMLRALWTHQPVTRTQTIPGALITNASGTQAVPRDKVNMSVNYRLGDFSLDLMERFYSSVHQNANATLVYDIPDVPAYWQTDVNLAYDFKVGGGSVTAFLNVNNLFNAKGGIFQDPGYTGSIGLRYPTVNYADIIGRYFTGGIRFNF